MQRLASPGAEHYELRELVSRNARNVEVSLHSLLHMLSRDAFICQRLHERGLTMYHTNVLPYVEFPPDPKSIISERKIAGHECTRAAGFAMFSSHLTLSGERLGFALYVGCC